MYIDQTFVKQNMEQRQAFSLQDQQSLEALLVINSNYGACFLSSLTDKFIDTSERSHLMFS